MSISKTDMEITASAIRGEARSRGLPKPRSNVEAYAVWDELARTRPKTVAARVYREATPWHVNRILAAVVEREV